MFHSIYSLHFLESLHKYLQKPAKPFNINWPQIPFSGKDRNLWDDLKELCSAGVFPEASICLILVDEKRRRKAVMWCIQKFMCLRPNLLNGSSYCMRAQTYKSTDRSGKFCGWSTDSVQIKGHRQDRSFL